MYQLTSGADVLRLRDGALIPDVPDNGDRAAYEAWLADGGVPEPAPEAPPPPAPPTKADLMAQLLALQAQIAALAD